MTALIIKSSKIFLLKFSFENSYLKFDASYLAQNGSFVVFFFKKVALTSESVINYCPYKAAKSEH